MDDTDIRLLGLLQKDCKRTTKAYALDLGLSTTAVYERIKRLEREGVISNYVALLNKQVVGMDFTVLCHVKLSRHIKEYVLQFEREVQQLEAVTECFHVSGDYDYILKIHVANMAAYRDFMVNKLTALNNIGSTQSSFVINEVKASTAIALG
ncbi:transcriptional regulator, AsnC family [Muriicola jejuensis]|uniref:AsnC family transcriptional regulator n=1 Tax=Muriicola jejuensis TaxID=504488 RepID=A0A6P0UFM7_9FLAO|nr:Lrp/AsnC family transcriptional regulator [Muriicola jejuensis]NER11422.1 AsnC family transcriptional regulator [Muriicola jejuensis]SMP20863.1 transcriptional regulator, AsnC family [Muriicola jejuensis]